MAWSVLKGSVMAAWLGLKPGRGGRTPKMLVTWRAWNYRTKGHAAFEPSHLCEASGFAGRGDVHISGNMETDLLLGIEDAVF